MERRKDFGTVVVNLRYDNYDELIDRRSIFGNPFPERKHGRARCIELFKEYFYKRIEEDEKFRNEVLKLRGKALGCWCKPRACHGDVIVEYLNGIDLTEAAMEKERKNSRGE